MFAAISPTDKSMITGRAQETHESIKNVYGAVSSDNSRIIQKQEQDKYSKIPSQINITTGHHPRVSLKRSPPSKSVSMKTTPQKKTPKSV